MLRNGLKKQHAVALYKLGCMCQTGDGVEQDAKLAADFLAEAERLGYHQD